jgi:hypothetical protein
MCSFSPNTCQAASHWLPGGEADLLCRWLVWGRSAFGASLGGVAFIVWIAVVL